MLRRSTVKLASLASEFSHRVRMDLEIEQPEGAWDSVLEGFRGKHLMPNTMSPSALYEQEWWWKGNLFRTFLQNA